MLSLLWGGDVSALNKEIVAVTTRALPLCERSAKTAPSSIQLHARPISL
jgi:hypothetical protein